MPARHEPSGREPTRTCIGCRRRAPQAQLIRVTLSSSGELVAARGAPGRGAWLCAESPDCFELARKRRAFSRSLRSPIGSQAVENLARALSGGRSPSPLGEDHGNGVEARPRST